MDCKCHAVKLGKCVDCGKVHFDNLSIPKKVEKPKPSE